MKKVLLLVAIIHGAFHTFCQTRTLTENFLNNVGDSVIVTGKIYNGSYLVHVNTKPTFLNLGDTSPRHRLMIRIEPEDRDKFPAPPEIYFLNKVVQVTGKLQEYKGMPLIKLSEPAMIKTTADSTTLPQGLVLNNYTGVGDINGRGNGPATINLPQDAAPSLRLIVPDSILQTNWIKSVTEKATEEKKRNLRLVQKEMDLRTAPFKDAPVIAQLHPGLVISILYTSKKWSYVSIASVDGFHNVNGFIKHKRFSHLKKAPSP